MLIFRFAARIHLRLRFTIEIGFAARFIGHLNEISHDGKSIFPSSPSSPICPFTQYRGKWSHLRLPTFRFKTGCCTARATHDSSKRHLRRFDVSRLATRVAHPARTAWAERHASPFGTRAARDNYGVPASPFASRRGASRGYAIGRSARPAHVLSGPNILRRNESAARAGGGGASRAFTTRPLDSARRADVGSTASPPRRIVVVVVCSMQVVQRELERYVGRA